MKKSEMLIPLKTPPAVHKSAVRYAECLRRLKRQVQQMNATRLVDLGNFVKQEFPELHKSRPTWIIDRRRLRRLIPKAVDDRLMRKMDRSDSMMFPSWETYDDLTRRLFLPAKRTDTPPSS